MSMKECVTQIPGTVGYWMLGEECSRTLHKPQLIVTKRRQHVVSENGVLIHPKKSNNVPNNVSKVKVPEE